MTEPEFVTLAVEDGVGTIRLDRPKMNAINEQLHWEVRRAAQEAARREDVRAVVLYGGERVFAAGADIKAMGPPDRPAAGPRRRQAGDRRGPRPAAGPGPGAGEPAVRRAVRHRGPEDRYAFL